MASKSEYFESLKEIFEDVSSLTPERLQEFVGATMKQLFNLKEQLESGDEKIREEGLKAASELKEMLESHLQNIAKLSGEDSLDLSALANQPIDSQMLDGQEYEILQNAEDQFQYLKKSFSPENKKTKRKLNLMG